MRMNLPHEVMEDPRLAAILMRLADETSQTIEVTAKGVVLHKGAAPIRRCRKIESLEHRTEERVAWVA